MGGAGRVFLLCLRHTPEMALQCTVSSVQPSAPAAEPSACPSLGWCAHPGFSALPPTGQPEPDTPAVSSVHEPLVRLPRESRRGAVWWLAQHLATRKRQSPLPGRLPRTGTVTQASLSLSKVCVAIKMA